MVYLHYTLLLAIVPRCAHLRTTLLTHILTTCHLLPTPPCLSAVSLFLLQSCVKPADLSIQRDRPRCTLRLSNKHAHGRGKHVCMHVCMYACTPSSHSFKTKYPSGAYACMHGSSLRAAQQLHLFFVPDEAILWIRVAWDGI